MLDNVDAQYKKEYDEALAKLDGTAEATTPEPEPEKEPEPVPEEIKTEMPDPLAEVRAELEKTKKALNDTKAWGTKNAQRLADIERDRREAAKPEILEANPGLDDAIRYVTEAPKHEAERHQQDWAAMVQFAHPGIFDVSIDPELEAALVAKRDALGEAWLDPMTAIREITAEKLAFTERQVGKRFVEAAKQSQKRAMSVPGAGGSANRTTPDPEHESVQRIRDMSDADFAKEVRRVKGY